MSERLRQDEMTDTEADEPQNWYLSESNYCEPECNPDDMEITGTTYGRPTSWRCRKCGWVA